MRGYSDLCHRSRAEHTTLLVALAVSKKVIPMTPPAADEVLDLRKMRETLGSAEMVGTIVGFTEGTAVGDEEEVGETLGVK